MGFNGEDRIELAAKIFQSDDRRELDEFLFGELLLEPIEKAIRDPFVGVGDSLAEFQCQFLPH